MRRDGIHAPVFFVSWNCEVPFECRAIRGMPGAHWFDGVRRTGDGSMRATPPPAREVGLVQRLRRSLATLDADRPVRILCGYSGGGDSLALLAALASLRRFGQLDLQALHVDHGVRPGSSSEARLVVEVAHSLGVHCDVHTVLKDDIERHLGVGAEEAMRRERFRAFAKAAERCGADAVALAHHQRDQAETVLLHLLRGAGVHGASGMRVLAAIEVPWWEDDRGERRRVPWIWRPFLLEPAESVRAFAESLNKPVVEDETNADASLRRNAIRHQVLPVMESVVPGAVANLARFADLAGEDSDELDRQAALVLDDAGDPEIMSMAVLQALPVGARRRVLLQWCRRRTQDAEITSNRIEEILRVADTNGRKRRVEIGAGWSVSVSREGLQVLPPASSRA